MAVIIHIETSTTVCSVAISKGNELLFEAVESEGPSHAVKLPQFIEAALKAVKANDLTIDAVAVSSGPGSYTGLRIGVSTAKGLCYGLDVPLIAVDTLAVMAQAARKALGTVEGLLVPMIDARRMEVYTTLFDASLKRLKPIEAMIIDGDSFAQELKEGPLTFFGNGAEKCREVIQSENARFLNDIVPLAEYMISFAQESYREGKFEVVAYYEPFYLKEFQATTPKNKI